MEINNSDERGQFNIYSAANITNYKSRNKSMMERGGTKYSIYSNSPARKNLLKNFLQNKDAVKQVSFNLKQLHDDLLIKNSKKR